MSFGQDRGPGPRWPTGQEVDAELVMLASRFRDGELTRKGLYAELGRYVSARADSPFDLDTLWSHFMRALEPPPPQQTNPAVGPAPTTAPANSPSAGYPESRGGAPGGDGRSWGGSPPVRGLAPAPGPTPDAAAAGTRSIDVSPAGPAGPMVAAPGYPGMGPGGAHQATPARRRGGPRWVWALAAVVVLLAVGATGVVGFQWFAGRTDRDYLSSLRAAGQGGQFPSDAAAIAHAHAVCAALKDGGAQQGKPVDLPGVKAYCPQFTTGFKVLETRTIDGTFVLSDTSIYSTGILAAGSGCSGTGGYSDITPGTSVVVKNDKGATLAMTTLGPGSGTAIRCTFHFTLTLTEGESDYIVTVSHRGDLHQTWAELVSSGIGLTLGS